MLITSALDTRIKAGLDGAVSTKTAVAEAEAEAVIPGLASRAVNGRQIKNACRTAQSLALSRGEPLALPHLTETLDAMEEFTAEFTSLGKIHRDDE